MERRLTAILSADVVGYSRLMGANEVGTLQSLQKHQAELIEPEIAARQGRVVKLTGDGILAEFPSVVNAVECATAIQRAMPARNADVPEDRRIEFRVGINLGDVIVEGEDLFGDGVNVAARLEGVARPGGIAVSQSVRDHIGNKLDVRFDDRGEEQLKNIDQPVRVFDIVLEAPAERAGAADDLRENKPTVAVLPFTNMSGDPEQEFFSDGIAEDIITDLSKISSLFVVGRNTSFTYKGMSLQLPKVAKELGVRFLLEGSVRKAGDRVRVTAQLIDGPSGGHLWADRYDRDLTDIFTIQDEITKAIVDQLKVRLVPGEKRAIGQAPTDNVEAYTYYLRGRQYFHNSTRWFLNLARQMFERAIELDPMFARAYAGLAMAETRLVGWFGENIPVDQILANAGKAIALAPDLGEAYAARGEALSASGRDRAEEAETAFERALELDPNNFEANLFYARHLHRVGKSKQSVPFFIRATEVQPDDCQAPLLLHQTLRALGRGEEGEEYARMGLKRAEEALRRYPESSRPAQLGACSLASLGENEQAKAWLERALAIDPDDTHIKYNGACVLAQMGATEEALDLLEKWSSYVGRENKDWMQQDPDLESLRGHPRYKKVLELIEVKITERLGL